MIRTLFVLLALGWLVFALSGYVVGYDMLFVNGSSVTYFLLMLDNGSLIPLVEPPPAHLVGTGERVEAELVFTEVGVGARVLAPQEPTQTIPSQPVSGPLLVTLVAAKLADVSAEPYNMSYIHDVVFGPFPSMRHFWEYVLGGAVVIRPYYIHWRWLTLPRTRAQYCNTSSAFDSITVDVINALYNTAGVRLPDRSYLVIVLNAQPSCYSGAAGKGTVGVVEYAAAYGTVRVAVTQYYHYADWLTQEPDVAVFIHEFGHNLGLRHPGTLVEEYDNVWDALGGFRAFVRLNSWLGTTTYLISTGLSLPHLYYLGAGQFVGSGAGSWLVGPRSGVYVSASDGVYTV